MPFELSKTLKRKAVGVMRRPTAAGEPTAYDLTWQWVDQDDKPIGAYRTWIITPASVLNGFSATVMPTPQPLLGSMGGFADTLNTMLDAAPNDGTENPF